MREMNLAIAFGTFLLISGQVYSQIPILDAYDEPLPKVVVLGVQIPDGGQGAPSDGISLFNGNDLSEWTNDKGSVEWTVHDGMFTVKDGAGSINTKREFGDF